MDDHRQRNSGVREARTAGRGFTLIEVVLVLVLAAIIAAIAWPSVQRLYASRRLGSAADQVRSTWCQARLEAMRSGRRFAFRYELDGDRYRLESLSGQCDSSSTSAGVISGGNAASSAEQTLPDGIKFTSTAFDGASCNAAAQPLIGRSDGWSDPILFYPDGTASDVQLVLADQQNRAIRVILRGLTGAVTLSDLHSIVE